MSWRLLLTDIFSDPEHALSLIQVGKYFLYVAKLKSSEEQEGLEKHNKSIPRKYVLLKLHQQKH